MSDSSPGSATVAHDWDAYWRGSRDGVAFASEGVGHPLVLQFWRDFFVAIKNTRPAATFVDFGSGNGALVESAMRTFGGALPQITCLDTSRSAIDTLLERYPGVDGLVADALAVPLPSSSFDIAMSQFGVEYAGVAAIKEMARLIAPGGQIALLMHIKEGEIYRECSANLAAVEQMQEIGFIPAAVCMFREAHICLRGDSPNNSRAEYDAAARKMLPIYRATERIMNDFGQHVAGDTVLQLYQEVDRINGLLMHHDPEEVIGWLEKMAVELVAYCGRMRSMCSAALDQAEFDSIKNQLQEEGFEIGLAGPLSLTATQLPLAWSLLASKPQ
jgi:SAM-dependent methyltransferase